MLLQNDEVSDTVEADFRKLVVSEIASREKIPLDVAGVGIPMPDELVARVVKIFESEIYLTNILYEQMLKKVKHKIGKPVSPGKAKGRLAPLSARPLK